MREGFIYIYSVFKAMNLYSNLLELIRNHQFGNLGLLSRRLTSKIPWEKTNILYILKILYYFVLWQGSNDPNFKLPKNKNPALLSEIIISFK